MLETVYYKLDTLYLQHGDIKNCWVRISWILFKCRDLINTVEIRRFY